MSQTVLVADDSKTIRQIVEMALKASSWEVVGVDSAQDAMQAARQSPSVILLDYYMPDGSGYDVCRALKQDSSTRAIPIVMLGGSFKQFDESLARQAGADLVLMKPFKTDALLDALEEAQNAETSLPLPSMPEPQPQVEQRLGGPSVEPDPITAESEPQLDLDSEPDSDEYGYGEPSVGDEESSEPMYAAPNPEPDSEPGYAVPDRFPDDDEEDDLPRPGASSQPRTPVEPARGSSPDINASSRAPGVTSPAPPAVAAPGLSREEIEVMIRDEVKSAVKTELPALLRNVMSEIFAQKIMPKLTEAADARVKATVNETLAAQIQTQVRAELERLLSEE